jgi:hypothetical protein
MHYFISKGKACLLIEIQNIARSHDINESFFLASVSTLNTSECILANLFKGHP